MPPVHMSQRNCGNCGGGKFSGLRNCRLGSEDLLWVWAELRLRRDDLKTEGVFKCS